MCTKTQSRPCDVSLSANVWRVAASLALALRVLLVHDVALAGAADGDRPQASYAFILEVAPKEGPAQHFSFVSAGGKLDASFISGEFDVNGASIPIISSFKAETQPLQDGKVWLGQLSVTHSVPYVTGFTDSGGASAVPSGSRVRTVPSRSPRPIEEGGASGDAAKPDEPASQPAPPRMMTRSVVQQANVGISTSLVLAVGKTVTLFEDSKGRIRLTVNKVPE